MSDLDKLIAAVEAGECPDFCPMWHGEGLCTEAEGAFGGSLDAALRLHEALLPGWGWETGANATFVSIAQVWRDGRSSAFQATATIPARAWLLAILKAVKARGAA